MLMAWMSSGQCGLAIRCPRSSETARTWDRGSTLRGSGVGSCTSSCLAMRLRFCFHKILFSPLPRLPHLSLPSALAPSSSLLLSKVTVVP